jgi:diguanylate cyclase (GGDEF)-like protein
VEPTRIFDQIIEASDGLEGLKLLLGGSIDVVLCDIEMPGLDGEKLLQVKASRPERADVPLIFLTANSNLERRVRLLEGGACDSITKPFHPSDLVARLRLHLKIKLLQDELREKNEILSTLSTTDALTGLRNRRYVDEILAIEFLRARRYGSPLALLMADVDHFKRVNDRYGHPAGDAVLRDIARVLQNNLRATDVAGRYGGEEFIVVMPQNSVNGAIRLAERWRASVENTLFTVPDGRVVDVTISLGVAGFLPAFEAVDDMVVAADAALYQAKQAGRNRTEVAPG